MITLYLKLDIMSTLFQIFLGLFYDVLSRSNVTKKDLVQKGRGMVGDV